MDERRPIRRLAAFFGAALVIRAFVHLIVFRDPIALAQISLLDLTAILLMAISMTIGALVGRAFGGVTIFAVAAGLPLAGIGAAIDVLMGSPHLSAMAGFVGLAAIGAGLAFVGPWHAFLGALLAIGGTIGLCRIHDPTESLLVVAPVLVAYVLLLLEMTRHAERPDPE